MKEAPASAEDAFFEEAFSAVQDGDVEGFKSAMRAAIEACVEAYDSDEEEAE